MVLPQTFGTFLRRSIWALPVLAVACTEIGLPQRQSTLIAPALDVLSLDFERAVFMRSSTASGTLAQAQRAQRRAMPTSGELRARALGPIPTEVQLQVGRLTTSGNSVSVSGRIVLRDLGLGKTLAEDASFTANGQVPSDALSRTAVFRAIEDDILAWIETLECDTGKRSCGIPPAPLRLVDPSDAQSEGADLNLATMVGSRPSGLRKINAGGIDPDQIVAAAVAPDAPTPAASLSAAGSTVPIGETVAALGLLDRSGFWLQTPVVTEESAGEVVDKSSGKRIAVTLIPKTGPRGGGSQISLAALDELGVDITSLITLVVYR